MTRQWGVSLGKYLINTNQRLVSDGRKCLVWWTDILGSLLRIVNCFKLNCDEIVYCDGICIKFSWRRSQFVIKMIVLVMRGEPWWHLRSDILSIICDPAYSDDQQTPPALSPAPLSRTPPGCPHLPSHTPGAGHRLQVSQRDIIISSSKVQS